jgi:hypothetical protein
VVIFFKLKTTSSRESKFSNHFFTVKRRDQKFDLQTWVGHILTWTFLLFTFLLWHSLSSTYFCCTPLSFSQFSPGITQPQFSLTLHNFATHTSALAYFCLRSVFYLKLWSLMFWLFTVNIPNQNIWVSNLKCVRLK